MTEGSICRICRRRDAEPGTQACATCRRDLEHALVELPRQLPLLEAALEHASRPAQGTRGGGRAVAPAPLRLDALTLLGPGHPTPPPNDVTGEGGGVIPLLALVAGWAQYLAYEHRAGRRDAHGTVRVGPATAAPRHGATVAGWCQWLTAYLPWALTQTWIDQMARQLLGALTACERITGIPAGDVQTLPCPACELWAVVALRGLPGAVCEACGEHLTQAQHAALTRQEAS